MSKILNNKDILKKDLEIGEVEGSKGIYVNSSNNYTGYNTIYDYLKNIDIPDGIHSMQLANNEIIDFEIYNYLEDTVFDETPILGDNIPDTKMLILKFHRNLTINADITITPQVRKKGMTIYCNGIIENNGTISMTARGANAVGQDVLLYKNVNGSYEFVPKIGGTGGIGGRGTPGINIAGQKGANGINRQSGGGGGGIGASTIGGNGSAGTSYSGGCGGGAGARGANYVVGGHASTNGGKGGNAVKSGVPAHVASGGAGNPAGNSSNGSYTTSGGNGTGGLLIIYTHILNNKNIIEANGVSGKRADWDGGCSGGGSINIFCGNIVDNKIITSNGGDNSNYTPYINPIAFGGHGSITIQDISTRYYLVKSNNKYLYYLDNTWETLDHDPTSEDFLTYGIYDLSIIPVELWTKLSGEIEILLGTDIRKNRNISFKAIPKDQILLYISDVDLTLAKTIKHIAAEDNILNNGIIKRLISVDSGNTWLYFNNEWLEYEFINPLPKEDYNEHSSTWSNWINSDHTRDIENIKLIGLNQEQLSNNGITSEQWIELLAEGNFNKKLRFLTIISIDDYTDKAELRNINMLYDKFGEYIENRNFIQRQALNQIIITPQFSSKEIKINYIL